MNLVIAGRDTTAQGLSWTFAEMFNHPEVVDDIRKEIKTQLSSQLDGAQISYDEILQMQYTKAVFSEGLRLHPSVPK